MRKIFLVLIGVLLLVVSLGCATEPSAPAASAFATITYVDQKDTALQSNLNQSNNERSTADANINKRIDETNSKITSNAPVGYTKAEEDAKISDLQTQLTTLQNSFKQWQTGNAPTNPTNPYGSPYGTPQYPVSPQGQVTWVVNPPTQTVYTGMTSLTAGTVFPASTPTTLCPFTVTPSGYIPPYTVRVTNSSSVTQYIKPKITLSQPSQGGYYFGGTYPQFTYYSISIATGLGQVQGTSYSHFYNKTIAPGTPGYLDPVANPQAYPTTNNYNGWFPSNFGTFNPGSVQTWILQNGWWMQSQTNPVSTAVGGAITGNFPFTISPANSNIQQSPSFEITTSAPAFNGYGEIMLNAGQIVDMQITLQVGTLQQATLQVVTSISYRQ